MSETELTSLNRESLNELFLPGGSTNHHGSIAAFQHPVHRVLKKRVKTI
jgi:hypothetical protein